MTLYSVLFLLAVVLLLLGNPVRRVVRGTATRPLDPFFAMRVLLLAKASSLTGALLVGAAAAMLVHAVSRTGLAATPAFWPDVLTGVGALVLVAAGLVVEWWCRIPPQDRGGPIRPSGGAAMTVLPPSALDAGITGWSGVSRRLVWVDVAAILMSALVGAAVGVVLLLVLPGRLDRAAGARDGDRGPRSCAS